MKVGCGREENKGKEKKRSVFQGVEKRGKRSYVGPIVGLVGGERGTRVVLGPRIEVQGQPPTG